MEPKMAVQIKITERKAGGKAKPPVPGINKSGVPEHNPSYINRVLHLQRTIGNREVTRLIRSGVIRNSLKMGQPGAIYEKEAAPIADQVKRKPDINFSIVRSNHFPAIKGGGKYQACPPAASASQRHNTLDKTPAQIAAMTACQWGITGPEDLGIATQTCRDGANWRLVVTRVNSVIRTHSRLLPGQSEPVPGVNTTAANFCTQVTELDNLGDCAGSWYMVRAVRAHEAVHVDEWRSNFTTDWNALETAIEALTVPAAGATADRDAATTALRADPVFQGAQDTSGGVGTNFPAFWGIPDPNAQTDAAERAVVDPRIRWICQYAKWQKWNPAGCPICAGIGIV